MGNQLSIIPVGTLRNHLCPKFLMKSLQFRHFIALTTQIGTSLTVYFYTETSAIFTDYPLITFRRNKNIQDNLVPSALENNLAAPAGIPFSCSRAPCYTCSFLNSATSISGPKSNFVIRQNFTCAPPTSFSAFLAVNVADFTLVKRDGVYLTYLLNIFVP